MARTRYYVALAHEQFTPEELLQQAAAAERAGFDGVCCSDHFQPWWVPGESGHAWVWLGAAAALTSQVAIGSGVTAPVHRYHPALVAQALVTLERLAPGRAFLGLGSGESLNESPLGMDWPPPAEQLERLDEAVDIIDRLLDGETVTRDGPYFRLKEAVLHTRPRRRPPLYISAFHPGAAELAARRGDGVWTAADPEVAGPVLRAYGEACREAGRAPGEVLMHLHVAWDHDDDAAFGGARVWKATLVPEFFTDDRHDPAGMQEQAAREVSDDELRRVAVISSDPDAHVRHIRAVQEMGATIVVLMNVSGSNPLGTIRTYGERVLPVLRHEPIMVGGRP